MSKVKLYGGRLTATNMQANTNVCRQTQTNADERKANCVQCVGGCNLKTHPDVGHLFEDFQDAI